MKITSINIYKGIQNWWCKDEDIVGNVLMIEKSWQNTENFYMTNG